MRKLFALLVAAAALSAFAMIGAGTAIAGGDGCGQNCPPPNCNQNCPPPQCDEVCQCPQCIPRSQRSPGADCTDRRLGVYSRVDNVIYVCLFPKRNGPEDRARSIRICETPTVFGGQGGTAVDIDGLAFACVGPSGQQ
jgi:hypothetical protein